VIGSGGSAVPELWLERARRFSLEGTRSWALPPKGEWQRLSSSPTVRRNQPSTPTKAPSISQRTRLPSSPSFPLLIFQLEALDCTLLHQQNPTKPNCGDIASHPPSLQVNQFFQVASRFTNNAPSRTSQASITVFQRLQHT
jgi:hypothetical protein